VTNVGTILSSCRKVFSFECISWVARYVNSAFHPSGVGKSSTGLHGWS